jgi:hypothetical protein
MNPKIGLSVSWSLHITFRKGEWNGADLFRKSFFFRESQVRGERDGALQSVSQGLKAF